MGKSKPVPDALQSLANEIAQLRKKLIDATDILPSYDQRQYEAVSNIASLSLTLLMEQL